MLLNELVFLRSRRAPGYSIRIRSTLTAVSTHEHEFFHTLSCLPDFILCLCLCSCFSDWIYLASRLLICSWQNTRLACLHLFACRPKRIVVAPPHIRSAHVVLERKINQPSFTDICRSSPSAERPLPLLATNKVLFRYPPRARCSQWLDPTLLQSLSHEMAGRWSIINQLISRISSY